MSDLVFNPPPNWPKPPVGWTPPEGWQPDSSWPAAPDGWVFWVKPQAMAPLVGSPLPPLPPRLNSNQPVLAPPVTPVFTSPVFKSAFNSPAPFVSSQLQVQTLIEPQKPSKKKSKWLTVGLPVGLVGFGLLFAGGVAGLNSLNDYIAEIPTASTQEECVTEYSNAGEIYVCEMYPAPEDVSVEEARAFIQAEYNRLQGELNTYENGVNFDSYGFWLKESLEESSRKTTSKEIYSSMSYMVGQQEKWEEDYKVWEKIFAIKEENLTNKSGTVAEEELIKVSQGMATMSINPAKDACESISSIGLPTDKVMACVLSPIIGGWSEENTIVEVPTRSLDKNYSAEQWNNTMWHEFAHVIQNKYLFKLEASVDFQTLFNKDIEHHADCMVWTVKNNYTGGYGGTCSPEQLASAAKVWDGEVGALNPVEY